ncbi:hypothetical protein SAY87_011323 [Trapa incisa]|uniref:DUF8204 domain-containing protein n=1 Tax=Trapa incisa TaxID=236973 RepID=A0AAN7JBE4_9MYRT|nr:hypothetical protein SAY87_011323 [Trapa incisa]
MHGDGEKGVKGNRRSGEMGAQEEFNFQADRAGVASPSPPPPPSPNRSPNPGGLANPAGGHKSKSCKGCLYYSSVQKSKSQRPTCVGISRSLQQVPRYVVGETELEASKGGRTLTDFRYACVGYSVYLEKDPQKKQAELTFCVGLEVILDSRTTPVPQVSQHAHKREDSHAFPQRYTHKPASSVTGDDYLSRFARNASIVASGVAKKYVGAIDGMIYPYRRRPK